LHKWLAVQLVKFILTQGAISKLYIKLPFKYMVTILQKCSKHSSEQQKCCIFLIDLLADIVRKSLLNYWNIRHYFTKYKDMLFLA
jgi:hypothetical protein